MRIKRGRQDKTDSSRASERAIFKSTMSGAKKRGEAWQLALVDELNIHGRIQYLADDGHSSANKSALLAVWMINFELADECLECY